MVIKEIPFNAIINNISTLELSSALTCVGENVPVKFENLRLEVELGALLPSDPLYDGLSLGAGLDLGGLRLGHG